jgi:hypothetical protein
MGPTPEPILYQTPRPSWGSLILPTLPPYAFRFSVSFPPLSAWGLSVLCFSVYWVSVVGVLFVLAEILCYF